MNLKELNAIEEVLINNIKTKERELMDLKIALRDKYYEKDDKVYRSWRKKMDDSEKEELHIANEEVIKARETYMAFNKHDWR